MIYKATLLMKVV